MKPSLFKNKGVLFAAILIGFLFASQVEAQVAFGPRLQNETDPSLSYINIKGDYTFLSNSVMNRVDWVFNATNTDEPSTGTGSISISIATLQHLVLPAQR